MRKLIPSTILVALLAFTTSTAYAQFPGGGFSFPEDVSLGDTIQLNVNMQLPGGFPTDPIDITALLIQGEDTTTLCEGSIQINESNQLIYELECVIPDDIDLGEHTVIIIISGSFGEFAFPGGGFMRILGDHDVDGSGSMNIGDVTALIGYIFTDGPPPLPGLSNGDLDCDGDVSIGDVTMLIGRIFAGGTLPCYAG